MSANRNDALAQLSNGIRKFEGHTASQVLASGWAGIKGLHTKDIEYFTLHGDQPANVVAQACMGRSMARIIDPLNKCEHIPHPRHKPGWGLANGAC